MTADNLLKGKAPMLERWGYMFIQQSYRNDGMLFYALLWEIKTRSIYKTRTIKQFIGRADHIYFKIGSLRTASSFTSKRQEKDYCLGVLTQLTRKQLTLWRFFLTATYATSVGQVECVTTTAK